MKYRIRAILKAVPALWILSFSFSVHAQDPGKQTMHSVSFSPGFVQIKDEYNYGLVRNGTNMAGKYTLSIPSENTIFQYEAALGLGVNFNKGLGLAVSLKPFDLFYGFRVTGDQSLRVMLGPYLSGIYLWQLYPELQAGQMFWMSSYETGPLVMVAIPVGKGDLNVSIGSAVAGLTSRPDRLSEEYTYSLRLVDFITNAHSNMKFGSLDLFNHTRLSIGWPLPNRRLTVAYEYEYLAFLDFPTFRYSLHTLNLQWMIGKNNTRK